MRKKVSNAELIEGATEGTVLDSRTLQNLINHMPSGRAPVQTRSFYSGSAIAIAAARASGREAATKMYMLLDDQAIPVETLHYARHRSGGTFPPVHFNCECSAVWTDKDPGDLPKDFFVAMAVEAKVLKDAMSPRRQMQRAAEAMRVELEAKAAERQAERLAAEPRRTFKAFLAKKTNGGRRATKWRLG